MAKKLKDINKDGKVTFADTWLGEKLSGKKMKGPNLKESMAGARRTSDATPKATAKAKKAEVSSLAPSTSPKPKPRPEAKPTIKVTKIPKTAQQKASETVDGRRSMYNANKKADNPTNRGSTATPGYNAGRSRSEVKTDQMAKFTRAEWKAMSIQEKMSNGLPADSSFIPGGATFKKAPAPKRDPKRG